MRPINLNVISSCFERTTLLKILFQFIYGLNNHVQMTAVFFVFSNSERCISCSHAPPRGRVRIKPGHAPRHGAAVRLRDLGGSRIVRSNRAPNRGAEIFSGGAEMWSRNFWGSKMGWSRNFFAWSRNVEPKFLGPKCEAKIVSKMMEPKCGAEISRGPK